MIPKFKSYIFTKFFTQTRFALQYCSCFLCEMKIWWKKNQNEEKWLFLCLLINFPLFSSALLLAMCFAFHYFLRLWAFLLYFIICDFLRRFGFAQLGILRKNLPSEINKLFKNGFLQLPPKARYEISALSPRGIL